MGDEFADSIWEEQMSFFLTSLMIVNKSRVFKSSMSHSCGLWVWAKQLMRDLDKVEGHTGFCGYQNQRSSQLDQNQLD